MTPFHEHDCEWCVYLTTYPTRHGETGDVWASCDSDGYAFIVRTGDLGNYVTTDDPGRYVLAPLVGAEDKWELQAR